MKSQNQTRLLSDAAPSQAIVKLAVPATLAPMKRTASRNMQAHS